MCERNGKGEIPEKKAEIVQGVIEFINLGPIIEGKKDTEEKEQKDGEQKKE